MIIKRIKHWIIRKYEKLLKKWRIHNNPELWIPMYESKSYYEEYLVELIEKMVPPNPIPKTGGKPIEFRPYSKLPTVKTGPVSEEPKDDGNMIGR